MAKNRGNKRKLAGKLTRNQKRKAAYAAQSGWKHGSKGARTKKKGVRLVRTHARKSHVRPTKCPRSCRQCYPGGVFAGACRRGRVAA